MRILLCEDDPDQLRLLENLISEMGHEVVTASAGNEAWELFAGGAFDLVITDWRMPDLSGMELLRRIRATSGDSHVILVSARSDTVDVCDALLAGADDFVRKPYERAELKARVIAAERLILRRQELSLARDALVLDSSRARRQAHTDPLTRLANRRQLDVDVAELLGRRGDDPEICFVICDVDHFKAYNDRYGHLEGDRALELVADILRRNTRETDGVYRFGGEEFLLLLRGEDARGATECVARIHREIRERAIEHADAREGFLTLSAGVARYQPREDPFDTIRRADVALYVAKAKGRARTELAEESHG